MGCYEASLRPLEVGDTPLLAGMPHMGWGQRVTAAPLMHYLTFGVCIPEATDLLDYDEQGNAYLEMWCPGDKGKPFSSTAPGPARIQY